MKKINNFPEKSINLGLPYELIQVIDGFVKKLGGKTYIIGGNVRDIILNNKISSDCDLVINIKIEDLVKNLKKNNIKLSTVGLKFGTIIVHFEKQNIEITSMRQDKKTDGRWAEIKFTNNIEIDAVRRDFTINSIYCDLTGNLFDPFNGQDDLKRKIVRFIGNPKKRIDEDYLRILRFLRFSYQISDTFDSKGLLECEKNINKILRLSWERRISEIKKIITQKRIENVLEKKIYNFIEVSLEKKINFHNFHILCKLERELNFISSVRRLKYLLRNEVLKDEDIITKKSSKEFKSRIMTKLKFKSYSTKEVNKLLYHFSKKNIIDQLFFDFVNHKITKSSLKNILKFIESHEIKDLPITGNDLISLGISEGKQIGNYIRRVNDWWLDNNCKPNKIECIEFLKSLPSSKRGQ